MSTDPLFPVSGVAVLSIDMQGEPVTGTAINEGYSLAGIQPTMKRGHAAGPETLAGDPRLKGRLTPRQVQIADLVAQGFCDKEIAYQLGLTPGTLKVYLSRIYSRMKILIDRNHRVMLAIAHVRGETR